MAPQTGCSQQKPSKLLTLLDLHVVVLLQRMLWLLVCFSLVKMNVLALQSIFPGSDTSQIFTGAHVELHPPVLLWLPTSASSKKNTNVMFRVHWGRLQLSQDLFQLGMEADVEKWPWEHTELSGAPQIGTEASYVCKSLALGSFLSAAQPLMTKEWIRRHTRETTVVSRI